MPNPGSFPGSRGKFLNLQTKLYAEAVRDGHIADTVADIQRRFLKRFPVTLDDNAEPSEEWIAQVDDNAPDADLVCPDTSAMDELAAACAVKEYEELVRRTKFKKDQIKRQLHYIHCKNRDADPSDSSKSNKDMVSGIASKLLGADLKLPRRKTAYNMWAPKNRHVVDPVFDARVKELGAGKEQHAAIRSAVYKEEFEKLSSSEQDKWTRLASAEHDRAIQEVKTRQKNLVSTDPIDRQKVISELPKFVEPILDAIAQHTGWKVTLIAGGPEPADSGRLNMISIHSGVMPGTVKMDFGRAENTAYKASIAPAFGSFLKKSYSIQECRARALPMDNKCITINDIADDGSYHMDVYSFEADRQEAPKAPAKRAFEVEMEKMRKPTKPSQAQPGVLPPPVQFGPPIWKKKEKRILPSRDASTVKLGPLPLSQSFVPEEGPSMPQPNDANVDGASANSLVLPIAVSGTLAGAAPAPTSVLSAPNGNSAAALSADPAFPPGSCQSASGLPHDATTSATTSLSAESMAGSSLGNHADAIDAPLGHIPNAAGLSDSAAAASPVAGVNEETHEVFPSDASSVAGTNNMGRDSRIDSPQALNANPSQLTTPSSSAELCLGSAAASSEHGEPFISQVTSTTSTSTAVLGSGMSISVSELTATPRYLTHLHQHNLEPSKTLLAASLSATPLVPPIDRDMPMPEPQSAVANTTVDMQATQSTSISGLNVAHTTLASALFPATVGAGASPNSRPVTPARRAASDSILHSGGTSHSRTSLTSTTPTHPPGLFKQTLFGTGPSPAAHMANPRAVTRAASDSSITKRGHDGRGRNRGRRTTQPLSTASSSQIGSGSDVESASDATRASPPASPQQSLPPSPCGSSPGQAASTPPSGTLTVPDFLLLDSNVSSTSRKRRRSTNETESSSKGSKRSKMAPNTSPATQRKSKRKAEAAPDTPNKKQRVGTASASSDGEQAFLTPIPGNCKPWARKALDLLTAHDLGPQWRRLVAAWVRFEQQRQFEEKSKPALPSTGRPDVVADWIKRKRVPSYRPDIGDIDAYEASFEGWWESIQPEWRVENGELLQDCTGSEDWSPLLSSGVNGVLSVAAALFFWGYSVRDSPAHVATWLSSVADVVYVFELFADNT